MTEENTVSQVNESAQQEFNFQDGLLRYLIENPNSLEQVYYFKFMLRELDFVIFYYIEHYRKKQAKLTYINLQAAIKAGKLDWVDPQSLLTKQLGGEKVTKNFLKTLTRAAIDTKQEYAEVLEAAVLEKYRTLMKIPVIDENSFEVLTQQVRKIGSVVFGRNLVKTLIPLLEGKEPYVAYKGTKYRNQDCLNLVQAQLTDYLNTLSPTNLDGYSASISKTFAQAPISAYPVYALNLGRKVMSDPQLGYVISLLAKPKLGKTRFTIGENVLPCIMLKKNVLYLSGEMQHHQILTSLLVKFIYETTGKFVQESICERMLKCINSIREDTLTAEDREWYEEASTELKQTVVRGEYELYHSGKYGKLVIKHISDPEDIGPLGISRYFVYEEYFNKLNAELDEMSEEERYALVVRDHVGYMKSSTGMSPTQIVTSYLQQAKTVASNKKRPFTYIIINHLATSVQEAIAEKGSLEGIEARGHNSNEEGKSCDAQWVLYEKENQRRDGLLTLAAKYDRFVDIEAIFKTNEFTLEANRAICQFKFYGEQKLPYPQSKEELKEFLLKRPAAVDTE